MIKNMCKYVNLLMNGLTGMLITVFTGFLKKFFRFSLAGGVVRVVLPGRTLVTLSLSSPETIKKQNIFVNTLNFVLINR